MTPSLRLLEPSWAAGHHGCRELPAALQPLASPELEAGAWSTIPAAAAVVAVATGPGWVGGLGKAAGGPEPAGGRCAGAAVVACRPARPADPSASKW